MLFKCSMFSTNMYCMYKMVVSLTWLKLELCLDLLWFCYREQQSLGFSLLGFVTWISNPSNSFKDCLLGYTSNYHVFSIGWILWYLYAQNSLKMKLFENKMQVPWRSSTSFCRSCLWTMNSCKGLCLYQSISMKNTCLTCIKHSIVIGILESNCVGIQMILKSMWQTSYSHALHKATNKSIFYHKRDKILIEHKYIGKMRETYILIFAKVKLLDSLILI